MTSNFGKWSSYEKWSRWEKDFLRKLNQQMKEDFDRQMKIHQEKTESSLKNIEEQAKISFETAIKNAETYLNQRNPTLAMLEFQRAKLLRDLLNYDI
jgi:predicted HNH restriction endonuclease